MQHLCLCVIHFINGILQQLINFFRCVFAQGFGCTSRFFGSCTTAKRKIKNVRNSIVAGFLHAKSLHGAFRVSLHGKKETMHGSTSMWAQGVML